LNFNHLSSKQQRFQTGAFYPVILRELHAMVNTPVAADLHDAAGGGFADPGANLRAALYERLASLGVLGAVRAQLRMAAISALTASGDAEVTAKLIGAAPEFPAPDSSDRLALLLVADFLSTFGGGSAFRRTLGVFEEEIGLSDRVSVSERAPAALRAAVHLPQDSSSASSSQSVLTQLVKAAASGGSFTTGAAVPSGATNVTAAPRPGALPPLDVTPVASAAAATTATAAKASVGAGVVTGADAMAALQAKAGGMISQAAAAAIGKAEDAEGIPSAVDDDEWVDQDSVAALPSGAAAATPAPVAAGASAPAAASSSTSAADITSGEGAGGLFVVASSSSASTTSRVGGITTTTTSTNFTSTAAAATTAVSSAMFAPVGGGGGAASGGGGYTDEYDEDYDDEYDNF
jgi:hypothetical protein